MPVFIDVQGTYEVDYRMFVACRDGRVYQIKHKGVIQEQEISIDSKPVGMVRFQKTLVLAGMDNSIQSFFLRGRKNYQLSMPSEVCGISKM